MQKQSEPGERGACRSVLAHHLREEETDIGKPVGPGGSLARIDVPKASTRDEEEKILQTPNRAVEVDLRIHPGADDHPRIGAHAGEERNAEHLGHDAKYLTSGG